jgi:uncharacterized membrane protein
MRGIDGIGNWILVLMATASVISMIAVLRLDSIVNHDLPYYGLQFNYGWAIPYWNVIAIVFIMAWINIIAAIAFQIYRIRTIKKDEAVMDQTATQETEEEVQAIQREAVICEQIESEIP